MSTLHEKSPCCGGKIINFGGRRRQCVSCRKTWTLWKRKRGRKKKRIIKIIEKYLANKVVSLKQQADRQKIQETTFRSKTRLALKDFITRKSWLPIPSGKLIMVADALWQTINNQIWTVYVIAVRSPSNREAIILPPVFLRGPEHHHNQWPTALNQLLDSDLKKRIIAIVCDGERSLIKYSKDDGWFVQRCHFHLYLRIANYARTGFLNRNKHMGNKIITLVDDIILNHDSLVVQEAMMKLVNLLDTIRSQGLKRVISGFLKNYTHYRTYLDYPNLHLPTTTNSLESFFGSFRDIQRKAKGFRTVASFEKWFIAYCKFRQKITCNGKNYQQN